MPELTPEQKNIFKGHTLKPQTHVSGSHGHTLSHRCDELGITRLIFTPKVKGQFQKPETSFILDGDDHEYTLSELPALADKLIERKRLEAARS